MDPSSATLTQVGLGYRPLAVGYQHHRRMATDGLPFPDGPFGGLAAMAATPHLGRMMGNVGMTPMGVGHDQSVYDRLMNQRYTMMQMQAMQQAAASDREAYVKTFRGLAAVTGTPFGSEQRRAAMSLANSASMMSPLFAEMAPDFLDEMGGLRGSATVMAKRVIDAGRYRLDPVSGRMGMSAESVGAVSNRLYGDLYSDDNLPRMRGVTAGQVGSLFGELQMRGMVGTAASSSRYGTADGRAATLRAAEAAGLSPGRGAISPEDLDKLALDPRVADKLRSFDTDRIKRSVKSYVEVVSAMRDIFGDMGKPNAPMAELVAGIEALTMGGMGQVDPGRMGMMVRQTYNLAKQTGVTMDGVMMMQQHAAQRAGQMGIEHSFAVQATQGALAFGGAYRAQGHAAHTAWGVMNADQVQQLDTNLRVQAASSNLANRMATATRMAEQVGGFKDGTDAARYVAAVRGGSSEWRQADGTVRSVMVSDGEFTRLMTGAVGRDGRSANITEGDVQTMLGQQDTNREYVDRFGVANTVRRVQGRDELHPFVGHRLQETLASRFRESLTRGGVGEAVAAKRAADVAAGISQKVSGRMFELSTEEFADTASRNRAIAGLIQDELSAGGMEDVLGGMGREERERFLGQTADQFYGAANRAIKGSMYRSFGNLQNVHRLTNRATLDESDRQQMQARFTAEMQEAMSPLGHGSMLQRAADALQKARPESDGLDVVASALGGVRIEDVNKQLMPHFRRITDKRNEVEALQQKIASESDPASRAALMDRLDVARRELSAQASHLAKTGEQFGLFTADTLTHGDLARAFNTTTRVMTGQNDLVGVRGNFGWEVSADNIKTMREAMAKPDPKNVMYRPLDDGDRAAIEAGRRQKQADAISAFVAGKEGVTLNAKDKEVLDSYVELGRKQAGQSMWGDDKLRAWAAAAVHANVMNMDPSKLAGVTPESDDDYRMLIRTRRRQIPLGPEQEAVDKLRKEFPGLTEEEAYELAASRMRAARLGIDEKDINDLRAKNPGKFDGPYGEMDARAELFAARAGRQYDVTEADVTALTKTPGYAAPDREAMDRFRDENKLTGDAASDANVTREMQRRVIMAGRQTDARRRWGRFWGSAEGAAAREGVDMASQDVATVADKLRSSPQMTQRLGTRALEISDALRGDQQRLRELAMYHSGGDLAKLVNRDYSTLDMRKADARETVASLDREVTEIQKRQRAYLAELASTEGSAGRRFQMGAEADAMRVVLDKAVADGKMTREQADKHMGEILNTPMALRIEGLRRDLGSDISARKVLGILPGDRNLSDLQRSAIAAVRFGTGSEEEIRHLVGVGKWDAMTPAAREAAMKRMREGAGTNEAAMGLLGISAEALAADRTGDLAKKVNAVRVGLASDAHARDVLPPLEKQRAGESDADFKKRSDLYERTVREVKTGLYNPAVARERLGVPADTLDPKFRAAVDAERERWGNEEEARRLMGKGSKEQLSVFDAVMMKRLAHDVGVLRRVKSPEDEAAIAAAVRNEDMLQGMADQWGVRRQDLDERGDSLVLTDDQRKRLAAAQQDHGNAKQGEDYARLRVMEAKSRMEALERGGLGTAAANEQYAQEKAKLQAAEADVKKFAGDKAAVEERVGEDAIRKGKTSADYLAGKGFVTPQMLANYRNATARGVEMKRKVAEIAGGLGLSPDDVGGVLRVGKMLTAAQEAAARKDAVSPVDLTRSILSAYGFTTGDTPDDFERDFSRRLDSTAGRGMANRILETQNELKAVASRKAGGKAGNAGVDELAAEYFKAAKSGKAEDMEAFRKSYGMWEADAHTGGSSGESNAAFSRFERAIQFQQQTDFLKLGPEDGSGRRFRTKGNRAALGELFDKSLEAGQLKPDAQQGAGGPQVPGRMEMSGVVTLKGDQLDFSGAWGGGRAYTPGVA